MENNHFDDLEKKVYEVAKDFIETLTEEYPNYIFEITSHRKQLGAQGLSIDISGSNGATSPHYEAHVYIHPQQGISYQNRLKFDRKINSDNRFEQELKTIIRDCDNKCERTDNNF